MERILKPTADDTWLFGMELSGDTFPGRALRSATASSARSTPPWHRPEIPSRCRRGPMSRVCSTASGPTGPSAALVPAADWLRLHISIAGTPLLRQPFQRTVLDVSRGVLMTETRAGPLLERGLRLVSLHDPSVGLQLIELGIEQAGLEVTLEASLDLSALDLIPQRIGHDLGVWHTRGSGQALAMAVAAALQIDGSDLTAATPAPLTWTWNWTSRAGQIVHFRRCAAFVTAIRHLRSRCEGARHTQPCPAYRLARRDGGARGRLGERWRCSDVESRATPRAQQALRFAVYHLNSAANPADEHVSIGARALTGEDYHGHVFWDTEIYPAAVLYPDLARGGALVADVSLPHARRRARQSRRDGLARRAVCLGIGRQRRGDDAGARDRAGSAGDRRPVRQAGAAHQRGCRLRGLAILAGDRRRRFPADAGAEILLETARFWSSRAPPEADGLGHIRGVIGPDEYHEHIDDNAFTNVMARWNIRRGLEVAALLRERWPARWAAFRRLWNSTTRNSRSGRARPTRSRPDLDPATGLFEQFAGFFSSRTSTWRNTPVARSRWTWCSAASGRSDRRSSSRPTSSRFSRCCRRSSPASMAASELRLL